MGFCRRHCTSQVVDRSHGRVGCRSWPTVRGRATSCIGRRYPTTKASKATIHFGLLAHRESLHAHLEMRAGKPRAPATSTDAMWRLASTRATPMWMPPEEHVAVAASDLLPKRYFVPKAPSPRNPPDGVCTPRRHGGAGPPHTPEPTASRHTALGRGGGTARAGPSTRASAHTTCTTPSPVLAGRGHGAMAQMCRMGVLGMGSGGGGCARRTGPPRARSVSGPRSRAGRRSPGRPASPPPPRSRPRRCSPK